MKRERVFRAKSRAALRQPECTNHGSSVAGRREKQGAFVLGDVATEEARFWMDSPATVHSWERRGGEQGSVSGVGGRACPESVPPRLPARRGQEAEGMRTFFEQREYDFSYADADPSHLSGAQD